MFIIGPYFIEAMGKNSVGVGILEYAEKKLGKRLFLSSFSDDKNRLAGVFDRGKEIKIIGWGELLTVCFDSANKWVEAEFRENGFRALYSGQSLAASADWKPRKGIFPAIEKKRFERLKKAGGKPV